MTASNENDTGPDDADQLTHTVKDVHRQFPTGVTIVTVDSEGMPYGLAVNAFSSVSLDPPVVLVCVAATSSTHPHLFRVDNIGVNILAEDQTDLLDAFARSGGDKFAGVDWQLGKSGSPVLNGCSAHLELEVEKRIQAYTHTILIGRVRSAGASDNPPMIYLGGGLFTSSSLNEARS